MIKATSILVETTDGLIALQHRDNIPNIVLPDKISGWGGNLEEGEIPEDGALRELEEEIGLKLPKDDLIKINTYQCTRKKHGFDCKLYAYVVKGINKDSLKLTEGQGIYFLDPRTQTEPPNLSVHTNDILKDCKIKKMLMFS